VGELFTSFDDAWSHFVAREEPLESFFDQFPEDDSVEAEGWVVVPPTDVKREVLRLQAALEDVPGLEPIPQHFLHVWLRGRDGADVEALARGDPFPLAYRNVNCFHTAVFVEAQAQQLEDVAAPPEFLPHMTIAVVRGRPEVAPVRAAVTPLRDTDLGTHVVDELTRIAFPAGRTTVLQPWSVIERRSLRR
jgi:hypothetical protein